MNLVSGKDMFRAYDPAKTESGCKKPADSDRLSIHKKDMVEKHA